MSRRNPLTYVRHMHDHAIEALEMAQAHSRVELETNRMFNLALIRLMEVLGEAANRVPDDFRRQYPQVPWRETSDLRNRLIHGYNRIDFDRLWQIVNQNLPPLIEQLEAILNRETGAP